MNGQVIYGDVLFIINFSMDFLVLFCVGKILHLRSRGILLSASAALGAVWSVGSLFINSNITVFILNTVLSFLLCFIAYPKIRGWLFVKSAVLFYGISLLLGGGVTASYMLLNKLGRGVNINSGIEPALSDIPLWLFCVLGGVCFILSFVTGRIFTRSKAKKEVRVILSGRYGRAELKCLCDSGNLLYEPLSGAPVIIVRYGAIEKCLGADLKTALNGGMTAEMCDIRIIPYSGVGGSGLIYGFLPESLYVNGTERRAVVAVSDTKNYGGFDGIVPQSLI